MDPDGADNIAGTLDDDLNLQSGSPCIATGIAGEDMGKNIKVEAIMELAPVTVTNPVDLAVDADGQLYVLSSSQNQVLIYSDQLVWQSTVSVSTTSPKGLALDEDKNLYIADTGGNRILKYTLGPSGYILDTTFDSDGIVGQSGTGDGEFNQPWDIAVGYDGQVYVTDSGNNRVQIFDQQGQFVGKWGQSGSGNGELNGPAGFCLLPSGIGGTIFLADSGNDRIQRLSAGSGYFYSKVGAQGTQSGQFDNPLNVCYDPKFDQIAVADTDNNRIQLFQLDRYGTFTGEESQIANLNLFGPMAVACAGSDTQQIFYIADTNNNRILKIEKTLFEPGESPLHTFESFKAALVSEDLDKALNCFLEPIRNEYNDILSSVSQYFQDIASRMGNMSLISCDGGMAIYHLENAAGTRAYPVIFDKGDDGYWYICKF